MYIYICVCVCACVCVYIADKSMAGMMTNVAHPPQVPPSLAGVSSLLAAWSGMCTGGAMTLTHGMVRRGDLSLGR